MSAAPVDEEPEVALTKWAIIRAVDGGHYHFIGMKSSGIGRFSSRIIAFNLSTMTGRTQSGRIYRLQGDPDYENRRLRGCVAERWGLNPEAIQVVSPTEAALAMPVFGYA